MQICGGEIGCEGRAANLAWKGCKMNVYFCVTSDT